MKITKLGLLTLIFVMTGFLLTACGNSTSYITDQTGKQIPVTSSDSDTYTFKLPSEQKTEEMPSIEIPEETVEPETTTTVAESEPVTDAEPLASEGPKTGEP